MKGSDSTSIADAGACRSLAEWATGKAAWPNPTARSMPTVVTSKHFCKAEESHGDRTVVGIDSYKAPPQKRARSGATDGIQRTARSIARTRHKPAARTPDLQVENAPTEVGCGAERLATTNAQGVHLQLLLGPSFQQGCAVEATDGQLIWVEGSVEEKVVYDNDSTVQQQRQEGGKDKHFKIPKKIQTGHKALSRLRKPTGRVGRSGRSNAGSAPTPDLKRGKTSGATVTPWRRTHSKSLFATTVEIFSRARIHSGDTAETRPLSASA